MPAGHCGRISYVIYKLPLHFIVSMGVLREDALPTARVTTETSQGPLLSNL